MDTQVERADGGSEAPQPVDAHTTMPMRRVRGSWIVAVALASLTFGGSLLVGARLFPHLSSNNDEPVYELEARQIEGGHLTLSAAAHDDFFRPWMSGRTGGDRLVLVEQPVLPAVLALTDLVFGSMRVGLGLVAAGAVLAVFGATRQLLRDERIALVAAAVFVASPLVIVQSALFLSYLLAVLLTSVVITLVSQALDAGTRSRLVGAGFVYGLLFFSRPIESLMLGFCLLVWMTARRLSIRAIIRNVATMGIGGAPVLFVCLAYNGLTTGNPVRFPLWAIGGNDAFGFGTRSIVDGGPPVHFGPLEAWLSLRTNLRAFPHWFVGGLVMLPLSAWGAVCLWRTRRTALALLAAVAVIFPLGYFFYWGNYLIISGRNYFGPHYYLGLLIPSAILVATALVDLVSRRAALAIVLVPALLIGTAVEVHDKIDANVVVRDEIVREVDAVHRAVHAPAIVVLPTDVDGPYVLHPRGQFANGADLTDQTLYAADLQGRNNELFDRFPSRTIYRLQIINDGFGGYPDVHALTTVHRRSFDVLITVTAQPARPEVIAYVNVNGRVASCALAPAPAPSPSQVARAHLTAKAVQLYGCKDGAIDLDLPDGPATISVGAARGGDSTLGLDEQVEQRYWVRTAGDGLDLITPADTWHTPPREPASVVDPVTFQWARFELLTPPPT